MRRTTWYFINNETGFTWGMFLGDAYAAIAACPYGCRVSHTPGVRNDWWPKE